MKLNYKIDVAIISGTVFLLLVVGLTAIGDFTLHNSIISRKYASWLIDSHIKRQLIAIPFALLAALLAARFSNHIIKLSKYLAAFGVGAALIILFIQKGYSIWPNIRFIYFPVIGYIRPGYWMLLFAFPLLAWLLARLDTQRISWKVIGAFAVAVCCLSFILAFLQDLPMVYLFCFTTVTVALMSSSNRWRKLAGTVVGILPITILLLYNLMTKGYWWRRLVNVYNYQNDPQGTGFQTWVAITDIADGGWFGKGLGLYNFPSTYDWRSYRYMMPNTLSEFILQITGREFGIMGLVAVTLLFCLLGFSAYRLIGRINGNVNHNLALYLLSFLLLAAVIGIIRTCNLLPSFPSMAVPFVAFGPKLLFSSMISLGVIAGLALQSQQEEDGDDKIGIMEPPKISIPVLNNLDPLQMGNEVQLLEKQGATRLHIDASDGHFTSTIGYGPDVLRWFWKKQGMSLEVHLLLESPEMYIKPYIEAGADALIVPIEAGAAIFPLLQQIRNMTSKREKPMRNGMSLFPGSPVSALEPFIRCVDMVILHTAHPGYEEHVSSQDIGERVIEVMVMLNKFDITVEVLVEGAISEEERPDGVTHIGPIFIPKRSS